MADFPTFRNLYASIRPDAPLGSIAGARVLWEGKRRTKYSKTLITPDMHQTILGAVPRYAEQLSLPQNEWLNPKHMVTWLFQECWEEFDQEKRMEETTEAEQQRRRDLKFNRDFQQWRKDNPRMPHEPRHTFDEFRAFRKRKAENRRVLHLRVVGE